MLLTLLCSIQRQEHTTMKATRTTSRTRRTRAQWSSLLARYHDGALTQAAFCDAHGLAISSFASALRRERHAPAHSEHLDAFVPVLVDNVGEPSEAPDWDLELTLGAGIVLRMRRV
jgi:hypothetical protein